MLSFLKRAHAETAVSIHIEQLRAQLESYCGPISDQVWRNRFIVGYLTGAFQLLLKVENPANTKAEYIGLQSGRLWQRFTGCPASQFMRDTCALADNEDPEYLKGFDRGLLWAGMVGGFARRDHPEVASLLHAAKQMSAGYEAVHGEPSHHMASAASFALIGDLFNLIRKQNQFAN